MTTTPGLYVIGDFPHGSVGKSLEKSCKPKPCWGIPRGDLEFKGAFDEASGSLVRAGGRFAALIQLYDGALKGARSKVDRMKADLVDNLGDDTAAAKLREEKIVLEKKVEALKGEAVKASNLKIENDQLRNKVTELEDRVRRDAKNSAAEMTRLRRSRKKWAELTAAQVYESMDNWYTPRLDSIGKYVGQRDAVEKAVVKIQVNEALLSYFRKIKGVEQDFDAVEKMLKARLRESKAAGDLVEDDEIGANDYAPPLRLDLRFHLAGFCFDNTWVIPRNFDQYRSIYRTFRPTLAELAFPGSPPRNRSK
ncbi:unnamed protein product [Microthlaspi erraticum]|uniref:Uncharacterized protein n=1 Tax=Microthlaspi erraticum TaxID=1685480 RepID=A0A6D2JL28_9BRAS|nr:unnamed protein product [Microthlaspi erraticum]